MANGTTKKAAKKAVKKVATKKVAAEKAVKKAAAVKKTASEAAPAKKASAKKAPAKKAVVKKVAKKKVAAKKASAPKPLTTIVAKIDIGFGNSLYLRGEGAGLDWDAGIVMGNAAADEWVWSSDAVTAPVEFKVLINDEIWAEGANAVVAPGERIVIEPSF